MTAMIDPKRGVQIINYVDDLSGEAKTDKDGAVKSAGLVCAADKVTALLQAAVEQARTMEVGSCKGAPLVCEVAGSHDAPSYELAFTGTVDAPGKLLSITVVSDGGMSEKWQKKADAYVAAQRAKLATQTCPK